MRPSRLRIAAVSIAAVLVACTTSLQNKNEMSFFVSSRNYGVRGDTNYKSIYSMCSESDSMWRVEAWEGTVSFKLLYGLVIT